MAEEKKKRGMTAKGGCKSVDRDTFIEQLRWALDTRFDKDLNQYKKRMKIAAKNCGLSEPTFTMRANQLLDPENYGELPEGFFNGKSDTWQRKKKD